MINHEVVFELACSSLADVYIEFIASWRPDTRFWIIQREFINFQEIYFLNFPRIRVDPGLAVPFIFLALWNLIVNGKGN